MNVTKNGVTITIADDEVVRMALERLQDSELITGVAIITANPPRIGEKWAEQGGIYAGVARGRDGAPDYYLIVGPEHDGATGWDAAKTWAAAVSVGAHSDFTLPFRKEQALCFANVPELFESEWYWSNEQHASGPSSAWVQGFGYGYQGCYGKDSYGRARAVRRLVIQ